MAKSVISRSSNYHPLLGRDPASEGMTETTADGLQFLYYRGTFMIPWVQKTRVSRATPQESPLPGTGHLPRGKSLLTPSLPRQQGHTSNLSKGCDNDFGVAGGYFSLTAHVCPGLQHTLFLAEAALKDVCESPQMNPRCLHRSRWCRGGAGGACAWELPSALLSSREERLA